MKHLKNNSLCHEALKLKKTLEMNFLVLGEYLNEIKEERLYEDEFESFDGFLMEMNMTKGTASKLINIYRTFVVRFEFSRSRLLEAGSWTKLAIVAPLAESKDEAEHWIEQSVILTATDLSRTVKEKKSGLDMSKCKHEDSYVIRICNHCGFKEQVHHE